MEEKELSELNFEELTDLFYGNSELLDKLKPTSPLYHDIYYENEAILERVHQINQS